MLLLFLLLLGASFCAYNYTCFTIHDNDTRVCNTHGECLGDDYCQCSPRLLWSGPECKTHINHTCQGVLHNDDSGCSGNGYCLSQEVCVCDTGWQPPYCLQSVEDPPETGLGQTETIAIIVVISIIAMVCVGVICAGCIALYCKYGRGKYDEDLDLVENFDFREDHQPYYMQLQHEQEREEQRLNRRPEDREKVKSSLMNWEASARSAGRRRRNEAALAAATAGHDPGTSGPGGYAAMTLRPQQRKQKPAAEVAAIKLKRRISL